jgi:hypothetical protein
MHVGVIRRDRLFLPLARLLPGNASTQCALLPRTVLPLTGAFRISGHLSDISARDH